MAEVALERLPTFAVAGVASGVGNQFVLAVTKVLGQFGIQRFLDQQLGELLQEAVFANQVFGFLVVGQQAGQEGFRDVVFLCVHCGSGQFGSFLPSVRLHKILHTPGPGSTRLTRAIVSEFAGFDVELAEQIMQLSESQIVNLVENLPLLMGESPLRWRHDSWLTRTRSKAMKGVSHSLHDKYLSEHGPVAQREEALNRIKRRYWRACVKTISPWLEERRQQVINVFSNQIDIEVSKNGGKLLKPASNGAYIELSRSELEYNNIVGMERSGKITANTPIEICAKNVCFLAKKIRDDVAHLRMPSLISLNDLIREMDRLQTVI